jgi:hypothetical protein
MQWAIKDPQEKLCFKELNACRQKVIIKLMKLNKICTNRFRGKVLPKKFSQ